MILRPATIRLAGVFLLAGIIAGGCIATTTPTTRFYVLTPLGAGAGLDGQIERGTPLSLEVAALRLPQYLERPQIVTRSRENRLEFAEYDQWGGNLRKNMIRVLAQNLSQLLATPDIAIVPYRPPAPPDFRIEVEVMQFERDAGGRVRLSVQWRLSSGRSRDPLVTRMTVLVSPSLPAQADFEPTVAAMSDLVAELSQTIGRAILENIQSSGEP